MSSRNAASRHVEPLNAVQDVLAADVVLALLDRSAVHEIGRAPEDQSQLIFHPRRSDSFGRTPGANVTRRSTSLSGRKPRAGPIRRGELGDVPTLAEAGDLFVGHVQIQGHVQRPRETGCRHPLSLNSSPSAVHVDIRLHLTPKAASTGDHVPCRRSSGELRQECTGSWLAVLDLKLWRGGLRPPWPRRCGGLGWRLRSPGRAIEVAPSERPTVAIAAGSGSWKIRSSRAASGTSAAASERRGPWWRGSTPPAGRRGPSAA